MAGRWLMSTINMAFSVQPAIVYWVAGQNFGHGGARDQHRHRRRLHDAPDAPALPDRAAALGRHRRRGVAGPLRPDLRVPRPAGRHRRGARRRSSCARASCSARCASRASGSATTSDSPMDAPRHRHRSVPAGTRTAIVGATGAGKTTLGYLVARLYEPQEGRVTIDGVDVRDATLRLARGDRRRRLAGDLPVPRHRAREPALRAARGDRRGDRGGRADGPDPRPHRLAARGL